MLELYKKMYATLVSRVDTSISKLTGIAAQETCDKQHVLMAAEDLRQALLEAEDTYLNA